MFTFVWLSSIILKMVFGGFIMGVSSRILGEWVSHYKNTFMEWVGRIIFWGGGCALTAVIAGMPLLQAAILIPIAISSFIIPPPAMYTLSDKSVIYNIMQCIVLASISFVPIAVVFWLHGYYWPKLFMIACMFPVIYEFGRNSKSKIWGLENNFKLCEFFVGFALGADLVVAILLKPWNVWPTLPAILQFLDN